LHKIPYITRIIQGLPDILEVSSPISLCWVAATYTEMGWSWASVGIFVGYTDVVLFTDIEGSPTEKPEPVKYFSSIGGCTIEQSAVDGFGSIAHGTLTVTSLAAEGVLESGVELHEDGERIVHYAAFLRGDTQ
jgi:hypothetical protein